MAAQNDLQEVRQAYVSKVQEHRRFETGLKKIRDDIKAKSGEFDKTEKHIQALQSVGQIIGECLTKLEEDSRGVLGDVLARRQMGMILVPYFGKLCRDFGGWGFGML